MDARHRQRRRRIDRNNARGRMLRRQDRHMQHALERHIRHEMAVTCDETAILADAAVGRDKAEGCGVGAHFASTGSPAPWCGRGVLALRSRSAANCTASMIWPYPVQRQILPEIASTISSRVGVIVCCNRACADRIMPGVQYPHCRPWVSQNASWITLSSPGAGARPSMVVIS